MQHKKRTYNIGRFKHYLHSIPTLFIMMKKNVKSNVLYSIPACILALLMGCLLNLLYSPDIRAICADDWCTGTISDKGAISPIATPTVSPTASISLSQASMISDPIGPGESTAVSTDVTVKLSDAESYSLILSVDNANIQNGNTTLTAGNAVSDNTWGYRWDNAASYSAPTTSGTALTGPNLVNGATNFTKTLTFGVKFSNSAEAGHYQASGTISLVATPSTTATITLAHITQMQQITPEICSNTPFLDGKNYSATYELEDVRDGNKYAVTKLGDNRCWMTSNLILSARNADGGEYYTGGRILSPTTSNISSNWTMPAQQRIESITFNDNTQANVFVRSDYGVGYYSWCAATAGTCDSVTSNGANATYSICPKGWKLPTGGTSGNTDFYNLFKSMGLTISDSLSSSDNTNWGSGDLAKVQASPYNFAYTGAVHGGTFYDPSSSPYGYWWSNTAISSSGAYHLSINSSNTNPSASRSYRYYGYAVRCVAEAASSGNNDDLWPAD